MKAKPALKDVLGRQHLRPDEYSLLIGASERTIRSWLADGIIPHIKIKRVVLIDVEKATAALEKFNRIEKSTARKSKAAEVES